MFRLLAHISGLDNPSGQWYLWWSGIAADLSELAMFGGLVAVARKHNCHVNWCWRIGRHPIEGTPYVVCRKHHPEIEKITANDLVKENNDG